MAKNAIILAIALTVTFGAVIFLIIKIKSKSNDTGSQTRPYNYDCPLGRNGKYCDKCGVSFSPINLKIYGGVPATPYSYPAQVYVGFSYRFSYFCQQENKSLVGLEENYCGGTLLNRDTVLTAAHCIIRNFTIRNNGKSILIDVVPNIWHPTIESIYYVNVGVYNTSHDSKEKNFKTRVKVSQLIVHQNYYDIDMLNDIAIIKLSREVELNSKVQLACLPDRSEVPDAVPNDGDELYASGWGDTELMNVSNILLNVKLEYIDDLICLESFTNIDLSTQFCAGDLKGIRDTCQGDSGGGVYRMANGSNMVLVGIVSYGDDCGKRIPGIYTRISGYLEWIDKYS